MTSSCKYSDLGADIGALVDSKNAAYGNSHGKTGAFLQVLWPDGIPVEAYGLALTFARSFDKMCRMAHAPTAFGEDPARDLVGYALLLAGREAQDTYAREAAEQRDYVPPKPPAFNPQPRDWSHAKECSLAFGGRGVCTCDPTPGDAS